MRDEEWLGHPRCGTEAPAGQTARLGLRCFLLLDCLNADYGIPALSRVEVRHGYAMSPVFSPKSFW